MIKKTGTWAEINLENLENNLNIIKNKLNKCTKICAVIKADAYGHGAVEIAKFLEYKNIDYLSVARIEEALELRKNGIKSSILCMGATNIDFIEDAIDENITLTVFDKETAFIINEKSQIKNKKTKIHIKINTGMNRIGFRNNEEAIKDIMYINTLKNIDIEGIFTHFAKADEFDKNDTYNQLNIFKDLLSKLEKMGVNIELKHVSNSASIIDLNELGFNMVRAGIAMYGLHPSEEVSKLPLKPVLSLKTKIIESKIIKKDECVSYGFNYKAKKDTQILTLSIGYADGFPRTQKNGVVLINNNGVFEKGIVVGNICMDQCMVEVENLEKISTNQEVLILGDYDYIRAEDIAKRINTINYEIICMISRRVSRIYKYRGQLYSKNYMF